MAQLLSLGANPMKWQDIIFTRLFWTVSIVGSIVLSIVANLLTPYVSAFITRHLHARRSGLRNKQIKRREQVIALQSNVNRRLSAKLDAIFNLLGGMTFLLLCLLILFLTMSDKLLEAHSISILPMVLLVLLVVAALLKSGADAMSLALTADRREAALNGFCKLHGNGAPTDEARQFEDNWDLREFGVNSKNVGDA